MIKSFDTYQQRSGDTDIIKEESRAAYYPLGLCGESGEVCEKIDALMVTGARMGEEYARQIALELGDVMWYVARMTAWMDVKLSDMLGVDDADAFQYSEDENEKDFSTGRYQRLMNMLLINSGKVADHMKKVIRDCGGEMTEEKRMYIIVSLVYVVKAVSALATWTGYPVGTILTMNIDKLSSRMMRGKINGNGDER